MFVRNTNAAILSACNFSTGREINLVELLDAVRHPTKQKADYWLGSLSELFSTVPHAMIKRFVKENNLDVKNLVKLHALLPKFNQNSDFIKAVNDEYFV